MLFRKLLSELEISNVNWTLMISIGALAVSIISLSCNVILEVLKRRSKLDIWFNKILYSDKDHPSCLQVQLIFRNVSHRPTAIIEIYKKHGSGGLLEGINSVELPIRLEPWDVKIIDFLMDYDEESLITAFVIQDLV